MLLFDFHKYGDILKYLHLLRCIFIAIFIATVIDAFLSTVCLFVCRCVLNWFGDWSTNAFYQVGMEFTSKLDIDRSDVSLLLQWFKVCPANGSW